MAYPRKLIGSFVAPSQYELDQDEMIANRSLTLADIAQQLLKENAGAALIRAAIICWERDFGRAASLEMAATALLGVHQQQNQDGHQRRN